MEIRPVSGLTIRRLPNGKKAIVTVVIIGPKTQKLAALALSDGAAPRKKGSAS